MYCLWGLNYDFNFPSKHLVDILHTFQLHQLTNSDTRITPTSSTCIDLIITQTPQVIKSIEALPEICSDHCVPCATVINNINTNHSFKRTLYNYDKLDSTKFWNMLSRIDWADSMQNGSIDDCAEHFNTTYFEAACYCMPVKTVTIRSKDAAWINADIRWAIKQRYRLFKKAKRSNKDEDWRAYRTYRNLVTDKIRDRKLEYLNELDLKASDPKQFGTKEWWKLVKQFMNKKGISDDIPPIFFNGTLYSSSEDKANVLNDYFIQQSTLDNPNGNTPNVEYTDSEITDIILTHADVHSVINFLDKSKATGPDMIPNKLLIATVDIITEPLTILFNRCLNEGIFPNIWKIAHVTPLHKKEPENLCNNYRPISLLSCVGKVLERCVHSRVLDYLKVNNIITQSQSGFMPGDSKVNQLTSIYHDLCTSFDQGIATQSSSFFRHFQSLRSSVAQGIIEKKRRKNKKQLV